MGFDNKSNLKVIKLAQLAEHFKSTSKEMNRIFLELDWIEKCEKGYVVTKKGAESGGVQKNYKGSLYVSWKETVKENKLLNKIMLDNKNTNDKEDDFRAKFKAEYRTNTGHFVRSRAEVIIANWLYSEYIAFAYERRVPIEEDMYCDFYIPKGKIYIEFWGYEDNEKYLDRKNKKLELYKKYDFKLIEIDNDSINNLDDFLPKELIRFGLDF